MVQVNEKGQLRLSHRALLPDASDSAKEQASESAKENIPPVNSPISDNTIADRSRTHLRMVATSPGKVAGTQERLPDKSLEKFVRRPASSARDNVNKDKQNKSESKAVS